MRFFEAKTASPSLFPPYVSPFVANDDGSNQRLPLKEFARRLAGRMVGKVFESVLGNPDFQKTKKRRP